MIKHLIPQEETKQLLPEEPTEDGDAPNNLDTDEFDPSRSLTAPATQRRRRSTAYRRSSEPPEETCDDKPEPFDRSDSAESFNAFRKKHQSHDVNKQNATSNASFSLERKSSLRRRRNADPLRTNIRKLESRESFELKQQALYSLQLDGTLQQMSNVENIQIEEEWKTKQNIWKRLAIKASEPDTSQKELIQRSTFLIISAMTVGAGILWGGMYVLLGEYLAAVMPFVYSAGMGMILMTCILYSQNKYDVVVKCQLTLILLLPMAVHLALGGVEESGGVMLWSFLCPMGAAFFRSANESLRWFYLYMGLSAGLLVLDYRKSNVGADVVRSMYFAMNVLGVKGVIFAVVFFFARELETEYNKSEEVLSNILPSAIVTRIKRGEFPIVDHVAGVSILFADLVGFTKASTELHPNFLIGLFLRDVFHLFDELVYKHKLEKIKTIGDAYMVVGGLNHGKGSLNEEDGTDGHHTQRIMFLAMDMLSELKKINAKYNLSFELRVGIHRGPVVAGVLGLKRFTYDVWGDSVNTASRMESNGVPSRIHISSDMHESVQHMRQFIFECCGKKVIKGKGEMVTYLCHPKDGIVQTISQPKQRVITSTDDEIFHAVEI